MNWKKFSLFALSCILAFLVIGLKVDTVKAEEQDELPPLKTVISPLEKQIFSSPETVPKKAIKYPGSIEVASWLENPKTFSIAPFDPNSLQKLSQDSFKPPSVRTKGFAPKVLVTSADYTQALKDGADHLVGLQADITEDNAGNGSPDVDLEDGGWDWAIDSTITAHSGSASPTNTYGVTAGGVLGAYIALEGKAYPPSLSTYTSLEDAYSGMLADPTIDSGGDFQFLVRLSEKTGDSKYANLAKARYDAKNALWSGSKAWADSIFAGRSGQGLQNGIIPWDVNQLAVGAAKLHDYFPGQGYDADADTFAQVIYEDIYNNNPGYFDETDTTEWWWTLGIAGALEAFTVSGTHPTERDQLATTLLNYQNDGITKTPKGAWDWNNTYTGGDYQTTAYAIMALMAYGGTQVKSACIEGVNWLVGDQRANGGWYWDNWYEYTEEEGEVLWAISLLVPNEVWVDDDYNSSTPGWGYDHFDKIQDGVDAVAASGLVHVADGNYIENVSVSKSCNIIGSGYSGSTVLDANSTGNGFSISADNVLLKGFKIINARGNNRCGIFVGGTMPGIGSGVKHVTIRENEVTASNFGIYLWHSDSNAVAKNIVHHCPDDMAGYGGVGIILWDGNSYNTLDSNEVYTNDRFGVFLGYSDDTKLTNYNTISYNKLYNNGQNTSVDGHGLMLQNADYNTVSWNRIYDHTDATHDFQLGIYLQGSSDHNQVLNNEVNRNKTGIGLYVNCTYNSIIGNKITCNNLGVYKRGIGIFDAGSSNNTLYQNIIFSNPINARDNGSNNVWDNGANTGNFWDDWASNSGFPTQYNVPGTAGSVDHYPLPNPSVVWVDDNWAGTPCGDSVGGHMFGFDAFAKIKDGIDHVGGSTVNVLPGTYNESDTISKSVTLNGDPGDATPGPGPSAPVLDGTGFSGSPAFCITQGVSNVTIQGFEIRNYGPNGNTNADGVVAWNSGTSNVTIRDNYMHHLGYAGVLVGNGWGGPQGLHDGWNITANIINNFAAYALDLENTQNTQATNNQISSPTFDYLQGIMVLALADPGNSITSSNITISGNSLINFPDRAINLVTWAQSNTSSATLQNVAVSGNNITTNFQAINNWKLGSGTNTIQNLTIRNNNITVNNPKANGYAVDLFEVAGTSTFDSNMVNLTGALQGGVTFFHGINVGGALTGNWTFANNELDGNNLGASNCGIRLRGTLPATAVLNITGNIVTEFANGIRSDALASGTDINVYNNNLAGNSGKGVLNGAGEMIDASGNWWGSNLPATVRTSANDGVKVDYTPWLDTGLDTQPSTPGFQGDFSVLWVDDNSPQTGPTGRIQEGVNLVSGSTVNVLTGTYNENIVVDKPVTLLGTGQDSVLVYPAISDIGQPNPQDPPSFRGSQMCVVQASNVTIDGFTFDGDSPTLTPPGTLDARNGIITNYNTGDWSNLKVQNCTVKNIYLRGIYAAAQNPNNLTGVDFNHNTISNVKGVSMQSAAMMLWGSSGNAKHNTISDASLGVFYHWYSDGKIDSNSVTTSEVCLGTNSNDAATSISYNTMTNSDQGIQTVYILAPVNVTFNSITACTSGVVLYGGGSAQNNVWDNSITGLGYYSTYGFWGSTDPYGALSANLKRNTIKDNFYGMVLNEAHGNNAALLSVLIGGASADRNFIYNNINYELLLEYCNDNQTATHNYWGKSSYAQIEEEIYHKVDQPDLGLVTFNPGILHGDVNLDGQVSVADVVYLINYLFKGGPAPQLFIVADVNRDGKLTISDAVYLINYLFKGGPAPKVLVSESLKPSMGRPLVEKPKLSNPVSLHSVEK